MHELIEGIFELNRKITSNAFIREEKNVSNAIQAALSKIYLNDGNEIDLVEKTIETLNSSQCYHFKLESMFIHGNRSQIEFTYYGIWRMGSNLDRLSENAAYNFLSI